MNKHCENELINTNFNDICGICLEKLINDKFVPINVSVSKNQISITAIHIIQILNKDYPSDLAPPNICNYCFDNLANIYAFILKCKSAEQFINLQSSVNNKPKQHLNLSINLPRVNEPSEKSDSASISNGNSSKSDNDSVIVAPKNKNVEANMQKQTSSKVHCEICKKSIARSYLRSHMRIHTGEKPYKCELCGKSFSQKTSLTFHEVLHSEKRDHMCTYCGKTFKLYKSLREHITLHTGEKPFKCQHCDKVFRSMKFMRQHRVLHLDDKRYQCEICAKQFKRRYYLQQHMATHESIKKHICHLCGHRFTQKHSLKSHLQNSCEAKDHLAIAADVLSDDDLIVT